MVLGFALRRSEVLADRYVGTVSFQRRPGDGRRSLGMVALHPEEVDSLRTLSFADGSAVEIEIQEES